MLPEQEPPPETPGWVRGISIPSALLGLVAFFLPWIELSCGPVHVSFSGYELATGRWEQKLNPTTPESYGGRVQPETRQLQVEDGHVVLRAHPRAQQPAPAPQPQRDGRNDRQPLLWIVPGACFLLLLLAIFGLPRIPTVVVALAAAIYLAYFGVTAEQLVSDPRNTGGILESRWLLGYWACWVGLGAPFISALVRTRRL
jgi:hypothetical protein